VVISNIPARIGRDVEMISGLAAYLSTTGEDRCPQATSRSFCASPRDWSFFKLWFSI